QGSRTGRCGWITSFLRSLLFFVWNTQCFWVDAHPRQVVVGLQQTVRHEKEEFGVSHCLKK
ncbi:hypothetical protein, partial [Corynebacterium argentoratense]|uniref:hypothetical protein n=1 Tax=Corynebacterium argentoratense TaxID=42817 RepID=UPI0028D900DD